MLPVPFLHTMIDNDPWFPCDPHVVSKALGPLDLRNLHEFTILSTALPCLTNGILLADSGDLSRSCKEPAPKCQAASNVTCTELKQ